MDDSYANGFEEIFSVTIHGKDIQEARFNAWTALEIAIGNLPRHHWKLAMMAHGIQTGEDENEKPISRVICQATWKYDPESDGGKAVELEPAEIT